MSDIVDIFSTSMPTCGKRVKRERKECGERRKRQRELEKILKKRVRREGERGQGVMYQQERKDSLGNSTCIIREFNLFLCSEMHEL
jgi:hypothetical protein